MHNFTAIFQSINQYIYIVVAFFNCKFQIAASKTTLIAMGWLISTRVMLE